MADNNRGNWLRNIHNKLGVALRTAYWALVPTSVFILPSGVIPIEMETVVAKVGFKYYDCACGNNGMSWPNKRTTCQLRECNVNRHT